MEDEYVFNPDDLSEEEKQEFDLMVMEEMLRLENSLQEEKEQQQQLQQHRQQLELQQQQQHQQQQHQQHRAYSNPNDNYDTASNEYNSLAFGGSSIRRPTPPTVKSEEIKQRKEKQQEYARKLEEDRILTQQKQKHVITNLNKNDHENKINDVPMALKFGVDENTAYQIKRDKQALYLKQLNAQQLLNQQQKESELAIAFSKSEKPKPQSPIAYQNDIPFRFARTRGPNNELLDEAETKKFKQKVYMDEIHSSRLQQPIVNERVSLRSLGRGNKYFDDDEPAFGANSLINSIGKVDDDQTKRRKQQAYAKQLQDSSSLPPIETERISLNSHSEVKKRREIMELTTNDNGSVNLALLAKHVAGDIYGSNERDNQNYKTSFINDNDSAGSFLATGLSTVGPSTAHNIKRQQQSNYARALEMDVIKKNQQPTSDERISLKEPPIRRDPSNTTLRLNSHDISTTDRLDSERFKREEYLLLSEQDKYRNPIQTNRAPIIRTSSPAGRMTSLSIGDDDESRKIADRVKKLDYSRQLAYDAKQKPIELERVPLSPRLRKNMALKLYQKEQQEEIQNRNISNEKTSLFIDSMDIATAQHLEQRERLRQNFQSDLNSQVKENENSRMRDLLSQYEVPTRPSLNSNIDNSNVVYPQNRDFQQYSVNPQEAAERSAAMRINRLGNQQEYSNSLRDQIIQLSSRKGNPYDSVPKESPRDHYSSILVGLPTNWTARAPENDMRVSDNYSNIQNRREVYNNMNLPNPSDIDMRGLELLKQRQAYINPNNPNESLYYGSQPKPLIVPQDYTY